VTTHDFNDGNGPVPAHQHANGGGWVADTVVIDNTAYVGPDAKVFGNAWICNDAWVYESARVFGQALIDDEAQVFGQAQVSGDARVHSSARVYGSATLSGSVVVGGRVWVHGTANLTEGTFEDAVFFELANGTRAEGRVRAVAKNSARVEMLRNQLQRSVCDELGGLRDAIQTLDRLAEIAPDHQHEIDRAVRAVSMAFSALTEAVDRCWDEGEQ